MMLVTSRKVKKRSLTDNSNWRRKLHELDYRRNTNTFASFSGFRNENEKLSTVCHAKPCEEDSKGLPNMPNLSFSEFGSQSSTNSESMMSAAFRIGTNQTHPKSLIFTSERL